MICKNCGNVNHDNVSFCGSCGMLLKPEVVTESVVQSESPKKKKKGLKIAIIIISVVLVMVALLLIGLSLAVKFVFSSLYHVNDFVQPPNEIEDYIDNVNPENELNFDTKDRYNFNSFDNLEDYCGMYYDGDNENGPCYAVTLISFDANTNVAVIDVNYVGVNASPYYSTGEITIILDEEGFAEFDWEDTWYNSGYGSVKFVTDGDTPYVEVNMTQTVTSDFNRASLGTTDTRILYYGE